MPNLDPDKLPRTRALRQIPYLSISSLYTFSSDVRDLPQNFTPFKIRYRNLERWKRDFEKHHLTIVAIVSTMENAANILLEEQQLYEDFLEKCQSIETTYYEIFELPEEIQLNNSVDTNSSKVKLPKIDLIHFDGDIKSFPTFIAMFNSLVHNNNSLSNIEKFNYLMSILRGTPLSIVKCIPLLDTNYEIAYNTLLDRYQDNRLLATSYWKEIYNFRPITNERFLQNLLDTFQENLSALKSMGFQIDQWSFILMQILLDKLDKDTRKFFESQFASKDIPSYDEVRDILLKRCKIIENSRTEEKSISENNPSKKFHNKKSLFLKADQSSTSDSKTNKTYYCFLCKNNHIVYQCPIFLSKTPTERFELTKKNGACLNCLATSHIVSKCTSKSNCRVCNQRHHSLLHFDNSKTIGKTPMEISDNVVQSASTSTFNGLASENRSYPFTQVLLSTVKLRILDAFGNFQYIRAILDSGSQVSFLVKDIATKLDLKKYNIAMSVQGLDKMCISAKSGVKCKIFSMYSDKESVETEAVLIDKICDNMPSFPVSEIKYEKISNLNLADPEYFKTSKIDMLIGCDLFPYILKDGRISFGSHHPVAMNTMFGWVLMGKTNFSISPEIKSFLTFAYDSDKNKNLDIVLKKFWETEEVPHVEHNSPENIFCEQYFLKTTTRTHTGRYVVSLPFKITAPDFGDIRTLAMRRFLSLERKLKNDLCLRETYSSIIQDYIENGHLEIAPTTTSNVVNNFYYLPHSCVFRSCSSSTPVRVVFDGSSKFPDKMSLNDTLYTGPKLQNNLVKILLNFRIHKYVFCADIKQMYRMIEIVPKNRDFLRILWRFDSNNSIQEFRLTILPFGLNCSPFLAIRTLQQLGHDYDDLPLASETLRDYVYVDDLADGDDSIQSTQNKIEQITTLLKRGGFELRKWCSNEQLVLADINPEHILNSNISFESEENRFLKVLGMHWNPFSDTFTYSTIECNPICTKRTLLSTIARIYDPLGYLTPCIILLKCLIQQLWLMGLDWDSSPPDDIAKTFQRFISEIDCFNKINFPRYFSEIRSKSCELHGFSDSSERGYCSVVYIRISCSDGTFKTFFVCSKSKVAPLKKLSLPRLELCSAVLLSKLMKFVIDTYKTTLKFTKIFAWSDSTVTLTWIKSSSHRWKTFVGNRVAFIQEIIFPENWFHVNSNCNPADLGTRGIHPSELLNNELWKSGPEFLLSHQSSWNITKIKECRDDEICAEATKSAFFNTRSENWNYLENLLNKYSSLITILRIIAFARRFINNTRLPENKLIISSPLTAAELHKAILIVAKYVQSIHFTSEIHKLENNEIIPKYLKKLNPFLDKNNILRVGGRLHHSQLSYDKKFPILLPNKCNFTNLLIKYVHELFLHSGINATIFHLFQMFWVISAKRVVRSVLAKCKICFRVNPPNLQPPMGNLPFSRIAALKPFSNVGVDIGGPFTITMSRSRGNKTTKAYLALYICFSTKAVHLELVSDLSSETFLMSFRRFIARRGRCHKVFSDCGTNFVASSKYLKEIFTHVSEKESIEWHFNPPSAPHMGGLWERSIRSVKDHLVRLVGLQILTFEELYTVFVQIEAVLNSRPLTVISTDPNDLNALTPGHFLTLEPLTALPDPDTTELPLNRLTRYQLLLRIHRDFWKRWSSEYLHSLQQRSKWTEPLSNIKEGSLVLIKNEQTNPLVWPLARVTKLYTGSDNVARVAEVKTVNGVLKRPLTKLCPLPSD